MWSWTLEVASPAGADGSLSRDLLKLLYFARLENIRILSRNVDDAGRSTSRRKFGTVLFERKICDVKGANRISCVRSLHRKGAYQSDKRGGATENPVWSCYFSFSTSRCQSGSRIRNSLVDNRVEEPSVALYLDQPRQKICKPKLISYCKKCPDTKWVRLN